MAFMILRPFLLGVDEYGHETAGIGDGKLERARGGSLVVAGRVLKWVVS
jgi:hypothetical protein